MNEAAVAGLLNLDVGLRSTLPLAQLQQLLEFPRLLKRFPIPSIINTGFLKVTDVYRTASNDLRLQILRVFKECSSHFGLILNTDEVLRRITTVLRSNDPVARAITLRLLGVMAGLVQDRIEIRQSLRSSLHVPNELELDAAIYAVDCVCTSSSVMAEDIFDVICDKINAYETPLAVKLKLIHVFRHMHHKAGFAAKARSVCLQLMSTYELTDFALVLIDTMTHLSLRFTASVPDQVGLVLHVAESDERIAVKLGALRNLHEIIRVRAPLAIEHLQRLLEILNSATDHRVQLRALLCFSSQLTASGAPSILIPDIWIVTLESLCASSTRPAMCALAVDALVAVTAQHDTGTRQESIAKNLVAFILLKLASLTTQPHEPHTRLLKSLFRAMVNIMGRFPLWAASTVTELVHVWIASLQEGHQQALSTSLARLLEFLCFSDRSAATNLATFIACIDPAQIQAHVASVPPSLLLAVLDIPSPEQTLLASLEPSRAFDVACAALQAGRAPTAAVIFSRLKHLVVTEAFQLWLTCLDHLAQGEAILVAPSEPSGERSSSSDTQQALTHLEKAVSSCEALEACVGSSRLFARWYLLCRIAAVRTLAQLVHELGRLDHDYSRDAALAQLFALIAELGRVREQLRFVRYAFFGIDESSARILEKMETEIEAYAFAVDYFARNLATTYAPGLIPQADATLRTHVIPIRIRSSKLPAAQFVTSRDRVDGPTLLASVLRTLRTPTRVPPFFFSNRSALELEVGTEPSCSANAGSHWAMEGNRQVLKVEGVIRATGTKPARKIDRVHVHVLASAAVDASAQANALQRRQSLQQAMVPARMLDEWLATGEQDVGYHHTEHSLQMHLAAVPRDDYFSATCMLDLDGFLAPSTSPPADGTAVSTAPLSSQDILLLVHVALEERRTGIIFHTGPDMYIPLQLLRRSS